MSISRWLGVGAFIVALTACTNTPPVPVPTPVPVPVPPVTVAPVPPASTPNPPVSSPSAGAREATLADLQRVWGSLSDTGQKNIQDAWQQAKGDPYQEEVVITTFQDGFIEGADYKLSISREVTREFLDWTLRN